MIPHPPQQTASAVKCVSTHSHTLCTHQEKKKGHCAKSLDVFAAVHVVLMWLGKQHDGVCFYSTLNPNFDVSIVSFWQLHMTQIRNQHLTHYCYLSGGTIKKILVLEEITADQNVTVSLAEAPATQLRQEISVGGYKKLISVQLFSVCESNPFRHKQNHDLTTMIRNHANKYSELGTFRHNKHGERPPPSWKHFEVPKVKK